ncbi:MAG: 30S ribosomal protein S4e [Candidatus Bathyarchaeia archaeon]
MGKKGQSSGLKRKPAPRFWPIHRKEFAWVVKPTSGPHSLEKCMPLSLVLRDTLGLAKTRKEARTIVSQGRVSIDGNIRTKDDFPIGLMDIISIPDIGKSFSVLPSHKGLILREISSEDAKFKLCRIEDKTVVSDGQVQLHLHDGSNILVKIADLKNPQEDVYDTLDTVKISLPEKQILEHIKMKEKDFAIITGGKNVGKNGKTVEIEKAEGKKRRSALVTIEDKKGNRYQTTLNFVFAVGETHSLISLAEAV